MLTGRAPSRSGFVFPLLPEDKHGIPSEVETLADVYKNNDYRTALIGKWHLGMKGKFTPNNRGFDYHYGLLGGWANQYTRYNPDGGYDWYENGLLLPKEDGHSTDLITNKAIEYINVNNNDDPFFLYLSYTAPHVPIQVDPKWAKPYEGQFDTQTRVGYAGMMAHLDYSLGKVVKAIEKKGILENTIIVFMSDNGPSAPGKKWYIPPEDLFTINFYGNDGVYGDTGDLRGWKASPYEGGVHVPAFIFWKNKLKSEDLNNTIAVQDLYPTLLNLSNIKASSSYKVEARDIFSSEKSMPLYWRTHRDLTLRYGGDWKLILNNASPYEKELKPELYNIKKDFKESKNCISFEKGTYKKLLKLLKKEFDKDAKPFINPSLIDK
ncbi:N-acetylgalactosamine 6-sulfate sulfatase [Algibacter lectus]|uniref:N-acetylgalactosamine 6-sulfate sulfatase n=1 Tax=Algibacter lectus TaxID=221126 RepID=A0A090X1X1_9FLAO|nr:N-acetylgalactosamine 6-sulfate sulfatase [Algibacter lectus]